MIYTDSCIVKDGCITTGGLINKDSNIRLDKNGLYSGTIAAGYNKLDYTSDNAFIEFGVDISAYHGNHKIVITNSAGKSAEGYLHSVAPGGLTLSGEIGE